MVGQVTVWQMTEEERLAYIEKHPIVKTSKKGTGFGFDAVDHADASERRKKARGAKDYKWRGEKANEARYNK